MRVKYEFALIRGLSVRCLGHDSSGLVVAFRAKKKKQTSDNNNIVGTGCVRDARQRKMKEHERSSGGSVECSRDGRSQKAEQILEDDEFCGSGQRKGHRGQ